MTTKLEYRQTPNLVYLTELGKGLGTKLGAGVQELGAEPPATWQVSE